MRLIDADAIRWIDLNSDIPHSKTSAIRVYIAFKDEIDRLPTIDLKAKIDKAYGEGYEMGKFDAEQTAEQKWIERDGGTAV